jgi:hypothetical protein
MTYNIVISAVSYFEDRNLLLVKSRKKAGSGTEYVVVTA